MKLTIKMTLYNKTAQGK